jgi:hypothetical protein
MADLKSSTEVQKYLDQIAAYDRVYQSWEGRVDKIIRRYKDTGRKPDDEGTKFNILWSNVQTLVPAVFSRIPKPDVSRRFRDNDPVGRVAALILERALEFEIEHYSDYRQTLKQDVHDRFLGGRGTAWARYEPHIKAVEEPQTGLQVTEDVDSTTKEQLQYECAPVDYVHWKDFGHSVARTWEEVNLVWRKVYLDRDMLIERFGKEEGKKIPLTENPNEDQEKNDATSRACIYEMWDKTKRKAVWISKSVSDILDEKDDPLELEGFFPCPRPLYATISNESLVPVPDFALYQDQANELDTLATRIDGLVKALQLKGVYDNAVPSLARLFTEGSNTDLIPVENWTAFAEKNGLAGSIDLVDLAPIAAALKEAYLAMEQIKGQVYEITGISDIIRGQSDPNETLGAQQLKGNYASLRMKALQEEVWRFATELLQFKAQIMCKKFDKQTLVQISAAQQLSPEDQQLIVPALELLSSNPLRDFRIEVNADSLVQMDENLEKQNRVEFLTGVGGYLEKAAMVGAQAPQLIPLLMTLLKFGVTGFKVGKQVEGEIDQAIEQLKQAAMHPQPPPPDPKLEADKMKAQVDMQKSGTELQKAKVEAQVVPIQAQAEMKKAQAATIQADLALKTAQVQAANPQPE